MTDPVDRLIDELSEDAPINGLLDEDEFEGFYEEDWIEDDE